MGGSYTSANQNNLNLRKIYDAVIGGEVTDAQSSKWFSEKPSFSQIKDIEFGDRGESAIYLKDGSILKVDKTISDADIDNYRITYRTPMLTPSKNEYDVTGQDSRYDTEFASQFRNKKTGAITEKGWKELRHAINDYEQATEVEKDYPRPVGMSLSPPARSSVRRSSGRSGRRGSV